MADWAASLTVTCGLPGGLSCSQHGQHGQCGQLKLEYWSKRVRPQWRDSAGQSHSPWSQHGQHGQRGQLKLEYWSKRVCPQ